MDLVGKLASIKDRLITLEELLSDPAVISDMGRFKRTNKEYKDLLPIVEAYNRYTRLLDDIHQSKELLKDSDEMVREMAREELNELEPQVEPLEEEIRMMLVPKDPADSKDVIFEIRSGTGGDEASIFAGDLYRMYARYFEQQGWQTEVIFENEGSVGGFNKIVLEISGEDVYGQLKFESGTHRVQRVPATEAKGRVHTSAATVAVIPKMEPEEVNINKSDLKVDTYRASGAGGQHVNKTESAIRITHLPTGIVTESQESRHQHKNRDIAMQRLAAAIMEQQRAATESAITAQRREMVGSGDRSEKIRTYNFPQNRLTDHRINLTLYNLDQVMEGNIGGIIEALRVADAAERMKAIEN